MSPADEERALMAMSGRVEAARLASRRAMALVLDMVTIARNDRTALDAMLLAVITQTNITPIVQQGDLQVAYSALEEPPPDELRRPISVNALANSLGLPFETVRRRVKGLLKDGACIQVEGGLIVPQALLASPDYIVRGFRAYERLRAFYYELRDLGLTGDLPPPTVKMEPGALPVRTALRLVNRYVLRVIDTMMRHQGDALNVLILLQVFCTNTEDFTPEMIGGATLEQTDHVRDALRKPVRPSVLARQLGLPGETIRRHVDDLVARGTLTRAPKGLILSSDAIARPAVRAGLVENMANLQRLFGGLSQLGVLAIWDQLVPARVEPAAAEALRA